MTRHLARWKARAALFAFGLLAGFGLLVVVSAAAEEQPLIAVLPFEAIETSAADARIVYTLFETGLVNTGAWAVLGQNDRDRILQAQEIAVADCSDERCAVAIGKLLAAQQIVLGTLARLGSRLIINAKIIDVQTSRTLVADSIGASTAEGLEEACRVLARQLAARARPGVALAGVPVEERSPAGEGSGPRPAAGAEGQIAGTGSGDAAAEPSGGEAAPVAAGGPAAEAGTGAAPAAEGLPGTPLPGSEGAAGQEPAPGAPARGRFWSNLSGGGAAFLGLLGNVSGTLAFELRRSSDEAYDDYMAGASNFDALWSEYRGLYTGYAVTAIGSYSFWTLAAAAPSLHMGLYRDQAFQLSPPGRRAYAWGTVLSVAGNVVDLLAAGQRYTVDFLYEDYLSAGADWDRLYDRYVAGYTVYLTERILSYTLWGLGAAGAGGAFFLKGQREPAVEGFVEKTLTVAGSALMSAGSFTRTAALNARQEYARSGGSDEQAHERYVGYSVASCLLWAAGGTALLLPVVRDLPGSGRGRGASTEQAPARPAQLRFMPLPGGLMLQAAWGGRGEEEDR